MLARVASSSIIGVDAIPIDVEVEVHRGQHRFTVIGLGDGAIRESRERVTSALKHSGFSFPEQVLVSLAPADVKKEGAAFDLPIALAILVASKQLPPDAIAGRAFFGELALDGAVKPIRGALPHTIAAVSRGLDEVIVPLSNLAEAALTDEIAVCGAITLVELVRYLRGQAEARRPHAAARGTTPLVPPLQVADVRGQAGAKRALEIAAAGGHNLLFIGPPGCGKSMLAERLPYILPPLSRSEVLEVVKVHSIAGLSTGGLFEGIRPFRKPHHVVSDAGLIGGGAFPRPGEISLAHHGVLFLDEFPEFRRTALEALRAPLESGKVLVTRAKAAIEYPARFQLMAAMNPCPCGRLGMRVTDNPCVCSASQVFNYLKKLSQPILDRIDLHVDLEPVALQEITAPRRDDGDGDEDAPLRSRVGEARDRQISRQRVCNAQLDGKALWRFLALDPLALSLVEAMSRKLSMSARGFLRVLKVARTIADLEGRVTVGKSDVAEAFGFRSLERIQRFCEGRAA